MFECVLVVERWCQCWVAPRCCKMAFFLYWPKWTSKVCVCCVDFQQVTVYSKALLKKSLLGKRNTDTITSGIVERRKPVLIWVQRVTAPCMYSLKPIVRKVSDCRMFNLGFLSGWRCGLKAQGFHIMGALGTEDGRT